VSFHAPAQIQHQGYRSGCIDDGKLVCCDAAGVFVFELATGELLRRVPIASGSSIRRVGAGYVVDVSSPPGTPRGGRLVHLPFDDAPPSIAPYRGHVKSWSGTEVALFDDGALEVRRWPSMELVRAVRGYHPTVDWANRLLLVSDTDRGRHVIAAIDGDHERRHIDYGDLEPQFFYLAGNGVAQVDHGFTLVGYLAGWRTKLCDGTLSEGSLRHVPTTDGRGLRCVIANQPCRFDVDFQTGELLTRPPGVERGQPTMSLDLWHPVLDAVVLEDDRGEALCDLDGTVVTRLPRGGQAKQWFDDGRALLVTYPSDDGPLRIEVWRLAG
jgi:hypothetical protein